MPSIDVLDTLRYALLFPLLLGKQFILGGIMLRKVACLVIVSCIWSCVGEITEPAGPDIQETGTKESVNKDSPDPSAIRIRLVNDPLLDPLLTLEGCLMWRAQGISCRIVPDGQKADMSIVVSDIECKPLENGDIILGRAKWDQHVITIYRNCIQKGVEQRTQEDDDALYVAVVAHEIGHQLGIWEHIPEDCSEPHLKDPVGGAICGFALMNPHVHPNLRGFITGYDVLAFSHRDTSMSSVHDDDQTTSSVSEGPDCELRARR